MSDLHGDAVTDGVDRFPEIARSLDQAVDHAIEIRADFFACLGDVTDPGPRSYRMIAKCIEVVRRLGRPSVWVTGNHDVLDDGSGKSVLEPIRAAGAFLFERPAFSSGGYIIPKGEPLSINSCVPAVGIVGLPYPPFEANLEEWWEEIVDALMKASASEGPVLVLGHLDLKDAARGSESKDFARGRDIYWPTDLVRELCPRAMMIGGHLHKAQRVDGVEIVGSLARLRHDEESNEPSFLVVEYGGNGFATSRGSV